MIRLFLISFVHTLLINNCPFQTYEEALISKIDPYYEEVQNFVMQISDEANSIGFGFWSQYITMWEVKQQKTVGLPFETTSEEQGQFMFLLQSEENHSNIILYYVVLDANVPSITHLILIYDGVQVIQVSRLFPPLDYEGMWILTYFTLNPQQLILEMSYQQSSLIPLVLPSGRYRLIIGGLGKVQISNQIFNLNFYTGRLSKLLSENQFIYASDHFATLSKQCPIPSKYNGEQTVQIIPQLTTLDGKKLLDTFTVDQQGNRYALSGWVKCDFSSVISQVQFQLLRISVFQDKTIYKYLGDELLQITYVMNQVFASGLQVIVNVYNLPTKILYSDDLMFSSNQYNILSSFDYQYIEFYRLFQRWHFIQFEYGRTSDQRTLFTMILYDQQIVYDLKLRFGNAEYTGQYINTEYYIEIGQGAGSQDLNFIGQISDLRFQFNYKNNLEIQTRCFYTCLTCNGPLVNNCLTCPLQSNRVYLQDLGLCDCKENYISVEGEQACQYFPNVFGSVQYLEERFTYNLLCQNGFFYIPTFEDSYICLSCPQKQIKSFNCVDCTFNQLTWYEKPICKKDIVSNTNTQDSTFELIENDPLNYDVFIINENYDLQLLPGVQDYCDKSQEDQNCNETSLMHFGKMIGIICKKNHYFYKNQCLLPDPQCVLADQSGQCIQCKDTFYQHESKCHKCPLICSKCEYNLSQNKLNCLNCPDGYGLQDGECQMCGINCKICLDFFDEILNLKYLRCYRCIDDSLYALSLDAIKCVQNHIENCKLAFQSLQDDKTINSLDYYFVPQQSTNIQMMCALCNFLTAYYVFPAQNCQSLYDVTCKMGVSFLENPNIEDLICLATDYTRSSTTQFMVLCSVYVSHCSTCIYGKQNGFTQCLICQMGYYAKRLDGTCEICPHELNCAVCYQQNKLTQDYWKIDVQAFYKYYINSDYKHSFSLHGQSQNLEDYEILCSSCQKGYVLYGDICIPTCSDQCLECQIRDGKSVCIKCYQDEYGRQLTIYQNQCIFCSSYCALCKVRSQDEISLINPLFQNQDFISSAYQCLWPVENINSNLFQYDAQLGQYVQCEQMQNCQKKFSITVNLYCSEIEYQHDLNQYSSEEEIKFFKQQNLYIDDLFPKEGLNFPEVLNYLYNQFEKYDFYYIANQQTIKVIDIQIVSMKQQTCKITGIKNITQNFSSNIFSAIYVYISFIGSENTILQFDRSITFQNFNKVVFSGFTISPLINTKAKQFIFESSFIQNIQFIKCSFIQLNPNPDIFQLIFNELQTLTIKNCQFSNLILSNIEEFILINGMGSLIEVSIENSLFTDNQLESCDIIKISSNNDFQLLINNIRIINSYFTNSKFASYTQANLVNYASLLMQQIYINCSIKQTNGFFDVQQFQSVMISDVFMKDCAFENSKIFQISVQVTFKNFNVSSCSILQDSTVIYNGDYFQQDINFIFQNIIFEDNLYDETVKLVNLQKYSTTNQILQLQQILLSKNRIVQLSDENLFIQLYISLIYLSLNSIKMQNITIIRGIGVTELSIYNSTDLSINGLSITQSSETKFRVLHKYVDCLLQYLTEPYYPTSILLHSISSTEIANCNISYVYNYNTPLIYFYFPDFQSDQQRRIIIIKNGIFQSNIQFIVKQLRGVALIFIESNQILDITIENITFFGNILHEYSQSLLINSATLINLNCIQCSLYLESLLIDSNIVINSTNSIIYVNSKEVLINNSFFQNNSLLQYEIIKPFIILGWDPEETINLDQLADIFLIESLSGNGVFLDQKLTIDNSYISNSFGAQGGAFRILPQGQSVIECKNTLIDNVSTFFQKGVERGGVFYLDGSSMTEGVIKFYNLTISNVYSRSQGGMLNIQNGQASINIQLQKITLNNVFAKLGSIIYCSFQSTFSLSQYLYLNDLKFSASFESYIAFLSRFVKVEKQEVVEILNERSLIYVEYGTKIYVKNLILENIYYESLITGKSVQKISLDSILILNSIFSTFVINLIPRANNIFSVKINQFYVQNVSQQLINENFKECFVQNITLAVLQFSCKNISLNNNEIPDFITYLPKRGPEILKSCFKNLENYISSTTSLNTGVVNIGDMDKVEFIQISNTKLTGINCQNCNNGLIFLEFKATTQIYDPISLTGLTVMKNYCGASSCINIVKKDSFRLMSEIEASVIQQSHDLIINQYFCVNNTASSGTCISITSFSTLLKKCIFCNNSAYSTGGSVQLLKTDSKVDILSSSIMQNQANIGGGIYSDSIMKNFSDFGTMIFENNVESFGGNLKTQPTSLQITINQSQGYLESYIINKTDNLLIEGFINKTSHIINLPSGSQISQYYYFDWKSQKYQYPKLQFRIVVLDEFNNIYDDLTNDYCVVNSRSFNLSQSDEKQIFTNNYTNLKKVMYDNDTKAFNLDNLTLNFDNQSSEIVLQLQFWCSPIKIPIFNSTMPYDLISTHNNYFMRINIQTLPCSYGEIKNQTDQSCYICNGEQDLYSLIINSNKCQVKDDITMISVSSAMLELREQYWRPYFDTTDITYCLNMADNCLGGWNIGDLSCIIGHIGALCEQCDIYDIRGDGRFAFSQKYECGLCSKQQTNIIIMIFTIIWTLLSLALSVRSQGIIMEKHIKIISTKKTGLTSNLNLGQQGVLIKILTNYLQIISSLSTFQLHFPSEINNVINIFGNPIQAISYSQDCLLAEATSISIHYARLIWQLWLPFFFLFVFLFIYAGGVGVGQMKWNLSVITTSVVYLYLYFQPNLIIQLVQLVSYRQISGYQWIQNNVAFRFDTINHYEWVIRFCLPMLILLAAIIPLFILWRLYGNKENLDQRLTQMRWGYLYFEYRLPTYFWEVVKIVQKDLIIIALMFYEDNVVIKGALLILIMQIYQELTTFYRPYNQKRLNRIDIYTTNFSLISFILGISIYITYQHKINQIYTICYAILACCNLVIIIILVIQIFEMYCQEFEKQLDSLRSYLDKFIPDQYKSQFVIKLLHNRGQARLKILKNFHKIKGIIMPIARAILMEKRKIAPKQFIFDGYTEQIIYDQKLYHKKNKLASENRQRFLKFSTFQLPGESHQQSVKQSQFGKDKE